MFPAFWDWLTGPYPSMLLDMILIKDGAWMNDEKSPQVYFTTWLLWACAVYAYDTVWIEGFRRNIDRDYGARTVGVGIVGGIIWPLTVAFLMLYFAYRLLTAPGRAYRRLRGLDAPAPEPVKPPTTPSEGSSLIPPSGTGSSKSTG